LPTVNENPYLASLINYEIYECVAGFCFLDQILLIENKRKVQLDSTINTASRLRVKTLMLSFVFTIFRNAIEKKQRQQTRAPEVHQGK